MKYTVEIVINVPRDKVIELFDSAENLKKWQPGLQHFEHISGEAGQPGAKSKLLYDMGSRKTEMIETITHRNLPDEFHGTYDTKGVHNILENYFYDEGQQTRWKIMTEFQFSGLMRIMSIFMPSSMFKKQTLEMMDHFQQFAENEVASVG